MKVPAGVLSSVVHSLGGEVISRIQYSIVNRTGKTDCPDNKGNEIEGGFGGAAGLSRARVFGDSATEPHGAHGGPPLAAEARQLAQPVGPSRGGSAADAGGHGPRGDHADPGRPDAGSLPPPSPLTFQLPLIPLDIFSVFMAPYFDLPCFHSITDCKSRTPGIMQYLTCTLAQIYMSYNNTKA